MVTLNDIKVTRTDKIDQLVIDEFLRSPILARMPFADAVSPQGGSTLTYGYIRQLTTAPASGRAIGSEYTPNSAQKVRLTTDLVVLGGSYQIDRVLAQAGPDEIEFQTKDKIAATINLFNYKLINGNKDVTGEFDGLNEMLTGSDTDFDASAIDCSTMSAAVAIKVCEALDEAILSMKQRPDYILANSKAIIKLKSAARTLGYLTQAEDAFGRQVESYNGVLFVDMGRYYNDALGRDAEVIPIDGNSGKTNIYMIALGEQGLHGVTLKGDSSISVRLPDFTTAGAVKTGDVEFIASVVLKNSRAAARLRGIQVQPALTTLGALTVTAAVNKITVDPAKAKIGNEYRYAVDSSATINSPAANAAVNTTTYAVLPANGVVVLAENGYARVVEVDKVSKLPVATGVGGPVTA